MTKFRWNRHLNRPQVLAVVDEVENTKESNNILSGLERTGSTVSV